MVGSIYAAEKSFVLSVVSENGYEGVRCADASLRSDKDVILAAVNQDGRALRFASEELQSDREVVLAAVNQHGYALKFASEEFRSDREVVLAAVNHDYLLPMQDAGHPSYSRMLFGSWEIRPVVR